MGKITSRKYCLPQIVKKRQFPCLAIILLTLIVWFAVFHPPNSYAALVKPGGSPNTFADLEPIVGNIIKVSSPAPLCFFCYQLSAICHLLLAICYWLSALRSLLSVCSPFSSLRSLL